MSDSPFDYLRARSLLWWIPISLITVIPLIIYDQQTGADSSQIAGVLLFLTLIGWVAWRMRRCDVRLSILIGPLPKPRSIPRAIGIAALLLLFSVGAFFAFAYVVPSYVEGSIDGGPLSQLYGYGLPRGAVALLVLVVLAPVAEELLFRGILLNRWTRKWSAGPAVLLSTLLFALLHPVPLGAFGVGLALAALYLKTRSLLLPIVVHAAHNAIAVGGVLYHARAGGQPPTIETILASVWIGGVCLAVSVPALGYLLYTWWPETAGIAPYDRTVQSETLQSETLQGETLQSET
jgi:hypothetical protein